MIRFLLLATLPAMTLAWSYATAVSHQPHRCSVPPRLALGSAPSSSSSSPWIVRPGASTVAGNDGTDAAQAAERAIAATSLMDTLQGRMPPPFWPLVPPGGAASAAASAAAAAAAAAEVIVRPARPEDVLGLARLCTDTFFGTHRPIDGPVIFLQRLLIWAKVLRQISRRVALEQDDRECRLLVAVNAEGTERAGEVCACVDVATHLFDREFQRFELMVDVMPTGREAGRRFSWKPYVASMAVDAADRRRGLGRRLLREAERTARAWGYREMMLEVAMENEAALSFYRKQGYRVVSSGEESSGIGATVVRTRYGFWHIEKVPKCLMRKVFPLGSAL